MQLHYFNMYLLTARVSPEEVGLVVQELGGSLSIRSQNETVILLLHNPPTTEVSVLLPLQDLILFFLTVK